MFQYQHQNDLLGWILLAVGLVAVFQFLSWRCARRTEGWLSVQAQATKRIAEDNRTAKTAMLKKVFRPALKPPPSPPAA